MTADPLKFIKDEAEGLKKIAQNGSVLRPEVVAEAGDEYRKYQRQLQIYTGNTKELPPLSSKIVRIFTSSTFTDTQLERNALMEGVYPKLKEYCREKHGLEFQVVDMRWGIRDEATDDHMTSELCMNEIFNCQRLSTGPNFVLFLGQKYGYRPIPTIILAKEFEMILECIKSNPDELSLLCTWYKLDTNATPPFYILQPVSSIYTNFNNKQLTKLQETAQNAWWNTMGKLQLTLRKAAQVLFIAKKIDREEMHNYFKSVTEREVANGILNPKDASLHTMVYQRNIDDMNFGAIRFARNFIDISGKGVDTEAQKFLKTLKEDKIPKALPESNIVKWNVNWTGKVGLDQETHATYIKEFCAHFLKTIKHMVDAGVERTDSLLEDPLYSDILQHLHMSRRLASVFHGREEMVETVRQYLLSDWDLPFIIYGKSGCGKTSILAKAATQTHEWFSEESTLVLRFIGTSPNSSSVMPLLTSICQQISFVYGHPLSDIPTDLQQLQHHTTRLLACATEHKPIFVFLDSLDLLSTMNSAHHLAWLPIHLPPYCKLVMSILPEVEELYVSLRTLVPQEESYLEVGALGDELGQQVLASWLSVKGRQITEPQWELVKRVVRKCSLPLYVKLVFDVVLHWKSYTKTKAAILSSSVNTIINQLLDKIEQQHGKIIVSRALGYITVARNGLSEAELEDLLSLDEKVLNDVFQYHLPPVRRIPPLLWTRIRNDLPGYLTERESDGVIVINWYHRQFIDVVIHRYFKNLNFLSEIHLSIAHYFIGTWGGGTPKPFTNSDLQISMFGIDKEGESDRKVPLQPCAYTSADGTVTRANLRKLTELPYNLIRSQSYDLLFSECFFNYNFLRAKMASMPLQLTLADFESLLEQFFDKDTKILSDTIRLSASVLSHYPNMLGPQVVGRLLPLYQTHPKIQSLIDQCDTIGLQYCGLAPTHHCYHTPGGPLQYSLEGHPFAPQGCAITSDLRYVVSASSKIIIFDLNTGEVFRRVNPSCEGIVEMMRLSPDNKFCVSCTSCGQVVICVILTGRYQVIEKPVEESSVQGVSCTNTEFIVWNEEAWYLYTMSGSLLHRYPVYHEAPLLHISMEPNGQHQLILRSNDPLDTDLTFVVLDANIEEHFVFHTAIAPSQDGKRVYACIALSDNDVAVYTRGITKWLYDRTLGTNTDSIYSLNLSEDENYLMATVALGFKVWNLQAKLSQEGKYVMMALPQGVRNIPIKNFLKPLGVFTRRNEFFIGGVRKNIYVWDAIKGNIVRTLDAHFARVSGLLPVTKDGQNKVVSSAFDKTIKVWNIENVYEDVFNIDRMEKPIDSVCLANEAFMALTVNRNSLGLWTLEDGHLRKILSTSGGAIVSRALTTADGSRVISAESGNIIIWDTTNLEKPVIRTKFELRNCEQLLFNEQETRVLVITANAATEEGTCLYINIPDEKIHYTFQYICLKKHRGAIITSDMILLALPSGNKSGESNYVSVYHVMTGTFMYKTPLKYAGYIDFTHLVAMPNSPSIVGIIDPEKGNLFDLKKKVMLRSVPNWNGTMNSTGKLGLYAPNRGGLYVLDLTARGEKKEMRTFIPRIAEGVHRVSCMFTHNDEHVVYYHSGHRTIRVFRVGDGKEIAEFKCPAQVNHMVGTAGGSHIIVGAEDGSLTMLTIADSKDEASLEVLRELPSRQRASSTNALLPGLTSSQKRVAKKIPIRARGGSKACLLQ